MSRRSFGAGCVRYWSVGNDLWNCKSLLLSDIQELTRIPSLLDIGKVLLCSWAPPPCRRGWVASGITSVKYCSEWLIDLKLTDALWHKLLNSLTSADFWFCIISLSLLSVCCSCCSTLTLLDDSPPSTSIRSTFWLFLAVFDTWCPPRSCSTASAPRSSCSRFTLRPRVRSTPFKMTYATTRVQMIIDAAPRSWISRRYHPPPWKQHRVI